MNSLFFRSCLQCFSFYPPVSIALYFLSSLTCTINPFSLYLVPCVILLKDLTYGNPLEMKWLSSGTDAIDDFNHIRIPHEKELGP